MSSIEKLIEGLKIFAKYNGDFSAEHDIIYASSRGKPLLPEEEILLKELDWKFNESLEAWYTFV